MYMEEFEYLLTLYDQGGFRGVALNSASHVLNPLPKKLKYLLELFDQHQIDGTTLVCPADPVDEKAGISPTAAQRKDDQ